MSRLVAADFYDWTFSELAQRPLGGCRKGAEKVFRKDSNGPSTPAVLRPNEWYGITLLFLEKGKLWEGSVKVSWVKFGQGWVVKGCCLEIFCTPDVFSWNLKMMISKKGTSTSRGRCSDFRVVFRSVNLFGFKQNKRVYNVLNILRGT